MPISEADKNKIEELRGLVKDQLTPYYDTDFNLLRWLKGHDYNIEMIKTKLMNHLLFRKSDWDLDHFADKPRNHVVHRHWKSGLTGEAIKTPNTVVNIEQTGGNDYWGMLNSHPINEILRARVHDLESMLRAVMTLEKKTGEQCSVLYIMDLSGLRMDRRLTTLLSGGLAAISSFMAEHYVEMVHSFVLVNVPSFITVIWFVSIGIIVDYFLKFFYQPFLAPVERGVPFPIECYYKGLIPDNALTLTISAGKTGHVDIEATEGSSLHWEIHSNGHFAFAIYELQGDQSNDVTQMTRAYPLFSVCLLYICLHNKLALLENGITNNIELLIDFCQINVNQLLLQMPIFTHERT
uniref:CRAL-TRIO domain-containing protein n=1 Tax=Heterorhabditis bacteriophora TaxID=37862 RepID=A0A1I7XHM2_HETBA